MLYIVIIVLVIINFIQFLNRIELEGKYLGKNSALKREIKNHQILINDLENDVSVLNHKLKYRD